MKTIVCRTALCVASALLIQPAAAFEWDLYGKLELQALHVDNGLYRYADQDWQIEAPFSRLGFKAKQQLTYDVDLIMVYEWQLMTIIGFVQAIDLPLIHHDQVDIVGQLLLGFEA